MISESSVKVEQFGLLFVIIATIRFASFLLPMFKISESCVSSGVNSNVLVFLRCAFALSVS